jgi:hypothetical protein
MTDFITYNSTKENHAENIHIGDREQYPREEIVYFEQIQ